MIRKKGFVMVLAMGMIIVLTLMAAAYSLRIQLVNQTTYAFIASTQAALLAQSASLSYAGLISEDYVKKGRAPKPGELAPLELSITGGGDRITVSKEMDRDVIRITSRACLGKAKKIHVCELENDPVVLDLSLEPGKWPDKDFYEGGLPIVKWETANE